MHKDGALAGRAVPQVIRGEAHAGARNAGFPEGVRVSIKYLLTPQRALDETSGELGSAHVSDCTWITDHSDVIFALNVK